MFEYQINRKLMLFESSLFILIEGFLLELNELESEYEKRKKGIEGKFSQVQSKRIFII